MTPEELTQALQPLVDAINANTEAMKAHASGSGRKEDWRGPQTTQGSLPPGKWQDVKMPFGKHKGKPLRKVPSQYLDWLAEKTDLRGDLADAIEEYKKAGKPAPASNPEPAPDRSESNDDFQDEYEDEDIPF